MATQLQLRRGTEAENDAFTGAVGELTYDTTNDMVRIHDGSTQGGFKLVSDKDVAHLAMPSDSYENITVLSSGGQYTALADGYISVHATATGGGGTYVELVSDTSPEFGCSQQAAFNGVMRLCMPVAKNSTYRFWYHGSPTINHFRFYYAVGTKPVI